jgi:hypothetical protein
MKTQKESERETHQRKLGIKCYNCLLSFRSFRLRLFLTSFIEKRTRWTYRPTDRQTDPKSEETATESRSKTRTKTEEGEEEEFKTVGKSWTT